MEDIITTSNTTRAPPPPTQQQVLDSNSQRRSRPQNDQNLNCPRCNSVNTKFCYYNNYSLTQPRYFCKTCRRYWTQGGSLRNVPVGGGSRKNKRSTPSSAIISSSSAISSLSSIAPASSPSSATISTTAKLIPDLNPPSTLSQLIPPHHHHHHQNPSSKIHPHPHHHHHGQDLNLAFPTSTTTQDYHSTILQPTELPKIESNKVELSNTSCSPSSASTSAPLSALELLRTGIASSNLSSYVPVPMPDSNALYPSSGFLNLQEMKPSLMGFPGTTDGLGLGSRFNIGSLQENTNNARQGNGGDARLLFPFGDINKFSSHHSATTKTTCNEVDNHQRIKGSSQDHHQGASGHWNGMLGGGTW